MQPPWGSGRHECLLPNSHTCVVLLCLFLKLLLDMYLWLLDAHLQTGGNKVAFSPPHPPVAAPARHV